MDKDVASALVMMANAIQNLADAQRTLIDNTGAIRSELRNQSKTVAKAVANQKKRAAEMTETARGMIEEVGNRVRTPRP
jgi:hypothetical protein